MCQLDVAGISKTHVPVTIAGTNQLPPLYKVHPDACKTYGKPQSPTYLYSHYLSGAYTYSCIRS